VLLLNSLSPLLWKFAIKNSVEILEIRMVGDPLDERILYLLWRLGRTKLPLLCLSYGTLWHEWKIKTLKFFLAICLYTNKILFEISFLVCFIYVRTPISISLFPSHTHICRCLNFLLQGKFKTNLEINTFDIFYLLCYA
jgi:hypothetical protein